MKVCIQYLLCAGGWTVYRAPQHTCLRSVVGDGCGQQVTGLCDILGDIARWFWPACDILLVSWGDIARWKWSGLCWYWWYLFLQISQVSRTQQAGPELGQAQKSNQSLTYPKIFCLRKIMYTFFWKNCKFCHLKVTFQSFVICGWGRGLQKGQKRRLPPASLNGPRKSSYQG